MNERCYFLNPQSSCLFSSVNYISIPSQTTEAAWSDRHVSLAINRCFIEWWRHYWKVVATVHPFRITVGLFIPVHSAASARLSRCVSYWSSPRGGTVRQPPPRAPLSPIRCSYDAGDLQRNGPVPGRHSAMTVWSLTNTVSRPRTQRSFTHSMLRLDQTAPWRTETGLGKLLNPNEAYSASGRTQWTGGSSLQKTRLGDNK